MGLLSALGGAAGFFLGNGPAGAMIGAGLGGAIEGDQAAGQAAGLQAGAAEAGIGEQRRQFDEIRKLLAPYTEAGTQALPGLQPYAQAGAPALQQIQALTGLGGAQSQQYAINQIAQSPQMQAMLQQGENAMLQNASATGGLRGGNIQAALAQFRPLLLNQMIEQQFGRLGGLAQMGLGTTQNLAQLGQSSAAGVGTAGLQTGGNIANLMQQQGAAQAGGVLGQTAAWNRIPQALGFAAGMGGFGGMGGGGNPSQFNFSPFGGTGQLGIGLPPTF